MAASVVVGSVAGVSAVVDSGTADSVSVTYSGTADSVSVTSSVVGSVEVTVLGVSAEIDSVVTDSVSVTSVVAGLDVDDSVAGTAGFTQAVIAQARVMLPNPFNRLRIFTGFSFRQDVS